MEQLRSWIKERYPVPVAVYSTPAAEALLATAGLCVVDFLRPLCLVNQLSVPMRVGEFSCRVQELQLGLYPGHSMYQPKPEVIDESLTQVLSVQAHRHAKLQALPDLVHYVQSESPEAVNPWYFKYQHRFVRLLKFTDHETLDHPVAGLFVMPADTSHPLQVAAKLLAPEQQLPLHATDSMLPIKDPMFAKHFVLLQDKAAGMEDGKALSNLATLSNTYGTANCSILKLYSSSNKGGAGAAAAAVTASGAVPAAVFQACRSAVVPGGGAGEPEHWLPEPPGGLGQALSPDDMAAAGQLLKNFCERTLLPRLEERIARLNLSVSTARKGLKNRLTRLWKGAAGDSGPPQDVSYPWHSVEAQMRCLADLAFLLGQYEFAVQMYRLAAQDYLAAPNSKWYAGAEVRGCQQLIGPTPAERAQVCSPVSRSLCSACNSSPLGKTVC
eukprot:GHRR01036525.1.p1 GENE.GHRR01036525.1~~GHRR01036525.1.p1  ORF type:complete len:441 (+),score=144.44 GHRR01036525.1:563-1885(+)